MATSAEVPMEESTLVATSMEVQMKVTVATTTTEVSLGRVFFLDDDLQVTMTM